MKNPEWSFDTWHLLFTHLWVKVFTLLFLLSILAHAWIGMWTIYTDYVKCYVARAVLNSITLIALVAFFFEGLLILWGV